MSKMEAGRSELANAIRANEDVSFAGGVFSFAVNTTFSRMDCEISVSRMRDMLKQACTDAGYPEDFEQVKDYLNGLIDQAEQDHLAQWGEVMDRRTTEREGFAFFSGPSTRKAHEALIRLSGEWWDDSTNPPRRHEAGEEVWVKVGKPFERV